MYQRTIKKTKKVKAKEKDENKFLLLIQYFIEKEEKKVSLLDRNVLKIVDSFYRPLTVDIGLEKDSYFVRMTRFSEKEYCVMSTVMNEDEYNEEDLRTYIWILNDENLRFIRNHEMDLHYAVKWFDVNGEEIFSGGNSVDFFVLNKDLINSRSFHITDVTNFTVKDNLIYFFDGKTVNVVTLDGKLVRKFSIDGNSMYIDEKKMYISCRTCILEYTLEGKHVKSYHVTNGYHELEFVLKGMIRGKMVCESSYRVFLYDFETQKKEELNLPKVAEVLYCDTEKNMLFYTCYGKKHGKIFRLCL